MNEVCNHTFTIVNEEIVIKNEPFVNTEVRQVGTKSALCYDSWAGRYFMGSTKSIEDAVSQINYQLLTNGFASLNDFYDAVGLHPVNVGEICGWSGGQVEVRFSATLTPDYEPALMMDFVQEPKFDFER